MHSFLTRRPALCAVSVLSVAFGTALALPAAPSPRRGDPPPLATAGAHGAVGNRAAPVTRIAYLAAPGQDNRVTISVSSARSGQITYVIDDVVPISPMPGCAHLGDTDDTKVSCVVEIEEMATDPYRTLFVELGDGDDTISGRKVDGPGRTYPMGYAVFSLGAGDDTWAGTSSEVSVVYGGPGDDTLTTLYGTSVSGNDGDDTLTAMNEASVSGDAGDDTIHAGPEVTARGGHGNDLIRGDEGAQTLLGELGDDTIHAGPGDDVLYGNEGDDTLYGDGGGDVIWGEDEILSVGEKLGRRRDDRLYGGPGTDKLYGGPGPDELYGGPGRDRLDGGTSPNTIVQD